MNPSSPLLPCASRDHVVADSSIEIRDGHTDPAIRSVSEGRDAGDADRSALVIANAVAFTRRYASAVTGEAVRRERPVIGEWER